MGEQAPAGARGNWKGQVRFAVALVLAVVALIVMFQNNEQATVKVLFWSPKMPRYILLAAVFLAGGVAGTALALLLRRRGR